MPTPSIQTLINDAQQVLNLDSISAVRSVVAVSLANANTGTPLNPNLTTQQLWNEFYQVVPRSKSDIESIIANQLMKFLFSPPAPGGVGANKQVIFNDNGILAGDAGLTYDKATDSLTISGAANFNGGALAAYLNGSLLVGSFANVVNLYAQSSGLHIKNNTGTFPLLTVNNSGDYTFQDGAGGTRMTLNSTGLGVGVSPSYKFEARGNVVSTSAGGIATALSFDTNGLVGTISNHSLGLMTNGVPVMRLDTSGNVGIGVTPSAWGGISAKVLEFGNSGSNNSLWGNGANDLHLVSNAYFNGANWIYNRTAAANRYNQLNGSHAWYTAPSGTAGNAITFTQAMTLDASGNLLVGKTANNSGTVGVEIQPNGNVWATKSASTSAATAWDTYSTGASAYRFYVGMDGTVNATNTTISAISDARLKENVQDIDVGLGAILALKPRKFDWKAGKGKDIKGDRGFIAQEFEQVFPQLVDEWKDPAPEGEAPYKSVRQDLIPVLVKAIQELAAEVNALKNA